MSRNVGLWIDHKKANIVFVMDKKVEQKLIKSNVEKQLGRFDGIRSTSPYESHLVPADDRQERDFQGHLDIYYDEVISCIHDAESILIFGPGEAKDQLRKRLEKDKLGGLVVNIETVDKMTDRQIAAKVQQYFKKI
ncbi:MAG: hypothetical protein EHM72_05255 [Calditrichaeota bacterium]|nr:MAG: hypothetical protein EHM72_05255 [Calditrichota bacterium]